MRCEECLPLVEAYHDGELERRQTGRVSAHLAACADCAAALDALSFEQEMYLRYDRGLEVSPALWEGVRAGVARLEEAEPAPRPAPRAARLRGWLAASFGSFGPRTAFASALALLVLGVALGALWMVKSRGQRPNYEVALNPPPAASNGLKPASPPTQETEEVEVAEGATGNVAVGSTGQDAPAASVPKAGAARAGVKFVNPATPNRAAAATAVEAAPPAPDHLEAAEDLLAVAPVRTRETDVVALAAERLPSPEEKEMARHFEQAQTLLRSFQNASASAEPAAVQLAYERRLSRKLLAENATLQLEAETSGDEGTKQVLDTLEPFLLDIANLRDDASREDVRSIRERMQKREIIAALQVY